MKPNLARGLYAIVFAMAVAIAPVAADAMGDEEFVGPFASWANVKTTYGAAGDGVTDDTAAIQKALNALGPTNPTLYFPAGTYRISGTLSLAGQQFVNIIGQDPAVTTILWGGPSGGTMLYLNGIAYSRFDRLTFNGHGSAAVAVDQSKADGTSNYFDTGNEYADDVFENAGTGLRCGNLGYGCAETSMLRAQFLNNTVAGVWMKNFNALDMWIWYSLFQNNAIGATNGGYYAGFSGAGNFHVFNSIFEGSTTADISYGNTGVFNFRNNYSIGSNAFVYAGGTGAPDNVTIEGNTILDTTQTVSVWQNDPGPVVFIDNIVRTSPTATSVPIGSSHIATATSGPVVQAGWYGGGSDLFSMGNTFTVGSGSCTVGSPVSSPAYSGGHCHEINDQVVARSTINPTMPTLPGTPPNNNRQIFEASPTGSGTACTTASPCSVQQAITNAANAEQSGAIRPVAHIAAGTYNIGSTITVPATVNSGIQIIGDGGYSELNWTNGSSAGPVLRLLGPSKVVLRDFAVNGGYAASGGAWAANGIEADNADQPGSRVFMEQANLALSQTNLFVDGLDHTNVELHDVQHGSTTGVSGGGTSVVVTGGPQAAAGTWQGSATNIFLGAAGNNVYGYGLSNGAHLAVEGVWNDAGSSGGVIANATGAGTTFTHAGSELALPTSSPTTISLDNFQGTAALLNLSTNGNIEITGNGGTAQVLGLGTVGPSATFFGNASNPAASTEFLNGQTTANPPPGVGNAELPEQGCCNATFLAATLNQVRTEQPTLLAPLANGVTDARFYRLYVASAKTGIHLEAASATPPAPIVNGACGLSNGADLTNVPTTGLCSTGTASALSGSGPWDWSCTGSNGGTTAQCSAQLLISGSCGSSNGADLASAPTTGLCSVGSASAVSGSGPFAWTCAGLNGGATASCSAQLETNGLCGAANGVPVSSAPTTGLCSAGVASGVSGSGPFNWSCTGLNGGTAASCAAPLSSGISPDGTILTAPSNGSLVTATGTWTYGSAQQSGESGQYQIFLNGSTSKWPHGQGYAAEMEVAKGGQLYTYNSYVKRWWVWTASGWSASSAPSQNVKPQAAN